MTHDHTQTLGSEADSFIPRHIGPTDTDVSAMLDLLGYESLDALIDATVPKGIRLGRPLAIHPPILACENGSPSLSI